MSLFTKTANDTFAPYDVAGNAREIVPQDAQVWGTEVERVITGFQAGGGIIFPDKAAMDATLTYAANQQAWVMGDVVVANNGVYRKIGASGTGSWVRLGDLPYPFIPAADAGAGTPNAIQATTSIPVSGSALIWVTVFEPNTASPVTISFNGGAAFTIKTNAGNDPVAGGVVGILLGRIIGTTFRLVSDQASAAVLAAAEAAKDAAEAAQAAAEEARDAALAAVPNVFAISRAAIKALNTATITAAYLKEADRYGQWLWKSGDFSTQIAADPLEGLYLKADAIAATAGAWVRQYDGRAFARWWGGGQAAIQAANALVDDITIDRDFAITSTATWPNGKNYLFLGAGKLSVATGVILTIRGVVDAKIWRTLGPNKIFNTTGTGKVVGLRVSWSEWFGAVGNVSGGVGADDRQQLQDAHDCVEASFASDGGRPEVKLRGSADYGIGSTLFIRPSASINLKLCGAGPVFGTRFTALASFSTGLGNAAIRVAGNADAIQSIAAFDIGSFSVVKASGSSAVQGLHTGGDWVATKLTGVQKSSIHDVHVDGFAVNLLVTGCRHINFDRCSFECKNLVSSIACLVLADQNNGFVGDLNFNACEFNGHFGSSAPSGAGVLLQSNGGGTCNVSGIRFNDCIYYGAQFQLNAEATAGSIVSDIWVNPGCQFEAPPRGAVLTRGIRLYASGAGSKITNVTADNLYQSGNGFHKAFVAEVASGGLIYGLNYNGNMPANCA